MKEVEVKGGDPFTDRQRSVITDVLEESSELLGSDVSDLSLPQEHAERLSLPAGVTYGQAHAAVVESRDAARARDFTRAVLALRYDPRVQGEELDLRASTMLDKPETRSNQTTGVQRPRH